MTYELRPQELRRLCSSKEHAGGEESQDMEQSLSFTGAMSRQLNSPVGRLPTELLSNILAFHFATTVNIPLPSTNHRYAPLSVCKRWYRAATSSPNCWTTLSIIWRVTSDSWARDPRLVWLDIQLQIHRHMRLAGHLLMNLSIFVRYDKTAVGGRDNGGRDR